MFRNQTGKCVIILIVVMFTISFFLTSLSFASSTPITDSINWLSSIQNPDGSWGTNPDLTILDTSTVLDTFKSLNITPPTYSNGVTWLSSQSPSMNDFLSRKIVSLYAAGVDVSTDLSTLIVKQNTDGGWSGDDDPMSMILDTALALQALKAVDYPDLDTIGYALGYLISTQNSEGGWGFYQGDDSNVYMTALVSMTLQQFSQTTSLATAINKATNWLVGRQTVDGGWGSVYETAFAYIALVGVTTDNTVLGNAVNYLISTQSPDGSWNDDPYSTALALRALHVAVSPPPQPTTGTVTGKVIDASTNQPLSGVSVVLQADLNINTITDSTGNFTLSNIPPGSQKIDFSLSGYATATATVNITAGSIINLGTIPLSPSPTTGIIKGTVTDAGNGQPLDGVTITVTGSFTGTTVMGVDGTFIFANVTPGTVTITASKTEYYSVTGTGTVVAGGILFFNPQLSTSPPIVTTGNLTGKVFDGSTNTPIQGATVSISGWPSTTTDAQGVFLIKDITPGTYQVTISALGYISQIYQVMILAGVTTDMQTIYLAPSPLTTTATGKVTDTSTGNLIAGAEVSVVGTSFSVKTDSTGTYTIIGINLLEFSLKASAVGYDSLTYSIKTTAYGTYTVDFVLNQSRTGNVRIVSLMTDEPDYPANHPVTITATIENIGDTAIDVLINARIIDQANNILAFISQQEEPALTLNPHSRKTISLSWDTGQNPPGPYTVVLSVVDVASGILQAEGETFFTIMPTVLLDGVTPLITPKFVNIKATETIQLSVSMTNRSNIDTYLSAEYEIKDPNGVVLNNGSVQFSVAPSESLKVVDLINFSHTFTQSGQYPVRINILSQDNILFTVSDTIHVAPSIGIEPSKMLTPTTVVPDGDKRIRIDIRLRGVEVEQ